MGILVRRCLAVVLVSVCAVGMARTFWTAEHRSFKTLLAKPDFGDLYRGWTLFRREDFPTILPESTPPPLKTSLTAVHAMAYHQSLTVEVGDRASGCQEKPSKTTEGFAYKAFIDFSRRQLTSRVALTRSVVSQLGLTPYCSLGAAQGYEQTVYIPNQGSWRLAIAYRLVHDHPSDDDVVIHYGIQTRER